MGFLGAAPAAGSGALVWLGVALFALAASAAGALFWLRAPRAKGQRAAKGPMACPSCQRSYPLGSAYCAVDATRLVRAGLGAPLERIGRCPRCRRLYAGRSRFCSVDAEELVPQPSWSAHRSDGALQVDSEEALPAAHFHGDGKICPLCAAKYDLAASFCGHDGAELVAVN